MGRPGSRLDWLRARSQLASSLTGSPLARTPVTIERTWRTRTPSAISTSIWSSSTTLVTLPTSPPEVMTVSPRRKFLTSSWCSFARFCCGRRIKKYMMTKIRTNGSKVCHQSLPPNGLAWAKAGVTNISSVLCACGLTGFCPRASRQRRHSRSANEIGADYSGQPPNCNAGLPRRIRPIRPFGMAILQPCRRPGKGAANPIAPMAKRVRKPPSTASSRPRTAMEPAAFERIAEALDRLAPTTPEAPRFAAADAFSWHPDARRLAPVANVNRVEMSLLKGIDRVRDMLLENTERFARGLPANNALLWGARHGQIVAGQGRARGGQCRARTAQRRQWAAQAYRNPPRGHRKSARLDGADARRALSLHRVLRRPVVRSRRHQLQITQGHARRRNRGPAGQRRVLRHVEPAPPDGARDDGERTLDRDQSRRSRGGEGVAVRPLRPVARLPPLQPG